MSARILLNWIGDRVAALPLAIVYMTDRCNSRCVACDYWRHGETDLPVERARWLAGELRRMATRMVLLTGGEPLFHPRWEEVATSFREAGLDLWLHTAGLALDGVSRRVSELCRAVTVSLDGATPDTYRAIRGVDGFRGVSQGIRSAVAHGAWISIRTTIQSGNFRQMPDLVRLAKSLGAKEISFLAIDVRSDVAFGRRNGRRPTKALAPEELPAFAEVLTRLEKEFAGEFASGFIAESPEKLRRVHQYFSALVGEAPFPPVRCNAPRFSAVVRPDGSLQPCFFIDGAGGVNGDETLADSLNTSGFRELRRNIREGRRVECARCVCSMWRAAPDLLFGRRPGRV